MLDTTANPRTASVSLFLPIRQRSVPATLTLQMLPIIISQGIFISEIVVPATLTLQMLPITQFLQLFNRLFRAAGRVSIYVGVGIVRVQQLKENIADFEKKCDEVEQEEDDFFGSGNSGGLPDEYRDAKKRRKKIRKILDKLKKEEGQRKDPKLNLTDPDARFLKKKNSENYTFDYNVGIGVDENQLIANVDVTNLSSDQPGLRAALNGVGKTIGGSIPVGTKVLCDAGYFSANNIDYLDKEKKLDGYIAPSMDFKTDKFEESWRKREFVYVPDEDALICRNRSKLARHTPKKPPTRDIEQFRATEDCAGCAFNRTSYKHVSFLRGIEARAKMTDKMLTDNARKTYVKRKTTVEPVFGDIKQNLGLRSFSVRGFACIVEVGLVALCHNIKKLAKMTNIFNKKWAYSG